ncbi:hypothetical protein AVEN_100522-1 [Araneus ventricosus]|uniref:Uncharacterized protein n=1 Tax=Araneus ventricosus TaxID=182803 RepID=A0A4Y2H105_ARAVE|nr:hypothetical protein AVEN_100522-1 [Araneus ventricosus]
MNTKRTDRLPGNIMSYEHRKEDKTDCQGNIMSMRAQKEQDRIPRILCLMSRERDKTDYREYYVLLRKEQDDYRGILCLMNREKTR